MAEDENRLSRLLADARWLSPEDMQRSRYAENAFSANPWQLPPADAGRNALGSGEIRNLPPRPSDAMAPVSEALSPTMGGYGLGQLAGDTYNKARAGDLSGVLANFPELAAAAMPIPGAKRLPHRIENPIRAYHGSPHDFDRFDLSKIGTGEGAQAYGHGLYFAENEGVARSYRNALTASKAQHPTPEWLAQTALDVHAGDFSKARADIVANMERMKGYNNKSFSDDIDRYQAALRTLDERGVNPPGKMYEVALHATPDQFLDWDKPLSGQAPQMRDATFDAAVKALEHHPVASQSPQALNRMQDFYRQMYQENMDKPLGSGLLDIGNTPHGAQQRAITDNLREAGIPGIRYLDQGSRSSGHGTSNYVVWTPEIIELLRKYGIAAPVAGGMLANGLAGDGERQ